MQIPVVDLHVAIQALVNDPEKVDDLKVHAKSILDGASGKDLTYLLNAIIELLLPEVWGELMTLDEIREKLKGPPELRRLVIRY